MTAITIVLPAGQSITVTPDAVPRLRGLWSHDDERRVAALLAEAGRLLLAAARRVRDASDGEPVEWSVEDILRREG